LPGGFGGGLTFSTLETLMRSGFINTLPCKPLIKKALIKAFLFISCRHVHSANALKTLDFPGGDGGGG
jgi:hypothetical protein